MNCQIYNKDCLDGLIKLPDGSVDLIVTDPPYCVGCTSNGLRGTYSDLNLLRPFFEQLFAEWRRVTKDGAQIYINTDWRTYPFLYPILQKYFVVRNLIVWEHGLMRPGNWYRGSYELIIFATKDASKRAFGGGERDIWRIQGAPTFSIKNRKHQSEKPVELCERMIKNSSSEGDTVLDCFMGSGTTGVACVNLNRNFIGYEIDEKYFLVANERISDTISKCEQALF